MWIAKLSAAMGASFYEGGYNALWCCLHDSHSLFTHLLNLVFNFWVIITYYKFLSTFLFDRLRFRYCRLHCYSAGLWTFLWFVGFCYMTDSWRRSDSSGGYLHPHGKGQDNIRASLAFSFFSIASWVRFLANVYSHCCSLFSNYLDQETVRCQVWEALGWIPNWYIVLCSHCCSLFSNGLDQLIEFLTEICLWPGVYMEYTHLLVHCELNSCQANTTFIALAMEWTIILLTVKWLPAPHWGPIYLWKLSAQISTPLLGQTKNCAKKSRKGWLSCLNMTSSFMERRRELWSLSQGLHAVLFSLISMMNKARSAFLSKFCQPSKGKTKYQRRISGEE